MSCPPGSFRASVSASRTNRRARVWIVGVTLIEQDLDNASVTPRNEQFHGAEPPDSANRHPGIIRRKGQPRRRQKGMGVVSVADKIMITMPPRPFRRRSRADTRQARSYWPERLMRSASCPLRSPRSTSIARRAAGRLESPASRRPPKDEEFPRLPLRPGPRVRLGSWTDLLDRSTFAERAKQRDLKVRGRSPGAEAHHRRAQTALAPSQGFPVEAQCEPRSPASDPHQARILARRPSSPPARRRDPERPTQRPPPPCGRGPQAGLRPASRDLHHRRRINQRQLGPLASGPRGSRQWRSPRRRFGALMRGGIQDRSTGWRFHKRASPQRRY